MLPSVRRSPMPLETTLQPSPLEEINSECIAYMYVSIYFTADFPLLLLHQWDSNTSRIQPLQSPDGSRVAMSTEAGQIYVFDLESNTLTSTYTSHAMSVRALSWSPDCQVCTVVDYTVNRPTAVDIFSN
jgi:WD40 repeat protein